MKDLGLSAPVGIRKMVNENTASLSVATRWSDKPVVLEGNVVKLLYKLNAHKTPFGDGRTLLDHLAGVHFLLSVWKAPIASILAGTLYPLFGTEEFRQLKDKDAERESMSKLVGSAEEFIYWINIMDHDSFFDAVKNRRTELVDTWNHSLIQTRKEDMQDMAEIMFAIHLEQIDPLSYDKGNSDRLLMPLRHAANKDAWIYYTLVYRNHIESSVEHRPSKPRESRKRGHEGEDDNSRGGKRARTSTKLTWVTPDVEPTSWSSEKVPQHRRWFMSFDCACPALGRTEKICLSPVATADEIHATLTKAFELDTSQFVIQGFSDGGTGPIIPLWFLESEGCWRSLWDPLYQLHILPADHKPRAPRAWIWGDVLAAMEPEGDKQLIQEFCEEVHLKGFARIRVTPEQQKVFAEAVDAGDEFFDAPKEEKRKVIADYEHGKFSGYATSTHREWFQARTVFHPADARTVYTRSRPFERKVGRAYLVCEDLAREAVKVLLHGLDVDADYVLSLLDTPGFPPNLAHQLGMANVDDVFAPEPSPPSNMEPDAPYDAVAIGQDVEAGFRRGSRDYPGSNVFRFFRYHIGTPLEKFKRSLPSSDHADIGLVTVAPCSPHPSLEILPHDSVELYNPELDAVPLQDVTLFMGETLGFLTNGYYRAAMHHVIPNYEAAEYRYSMPFFLRCHPESILSPSMVCAGNPALNNPVAGSKGRLPVTTAYLMDYGTLSRGGDDRPSDF